MTHVLKRLDEKLARMASGTASRRDFILADAKDADMAFGMAAPGPARGKNGRRWRSLPEYREQIRAVIQHAVVDIVLMSASSLEQLAIRDALFAGSPITPAGRANDTTDIWAVRGGRYLAEPSRPFRTALLDHLRWGRLGEAETAATTGADLGLYSLTFTNQVEADLRSLEAFRTFRAEAERAKFRYFLEVFSPNVEAGLTAAAIGPFLNDQIARCLAGVASPGRPLFLKIPYHGPAAMEELATYDPGLVVGILGGSAGTTRDAFQLLHDAQKYGARAALFGRKINFAEHPLAFIECLRHIADGDTSPAEAVRVYHDALQRAGLTPDRPLAEDLLVTAAELG